MAVNECSAYYATATHGILAPHLITDPRHNRHNLFDSEFEHKQLVRGAQAQSVQLSGLTKWLLKAGPTLFVCRRLPANEKITSQRSLPVP